MRGCIIGVGILMLGVSLGAMAQHGQQALPQELYQAFQAHQAQAQADPDALARTIEAGRERARFCNTCHGPDGSATRDNYPSLAGQNPLYLLDQIEQFANGSREKLVMNVLAQTFSIEEKTTLALYYANMPQQPAEADLALARQGAPVYQLRCAACHGSDGLGEEGYARIAGQQPGYIERVLREYRSGNSPRRFSVMFGVTSVLEDDDVKALAHYIASMR